MNGFIRKRMWAKAVLLLCGGTTLAATGCYEYKDLVDPCYPDRYNHMAEMEVNGPFATQVGKGHMLDQTVWNYYFEPGTDKLNGMGIDHLARLSRRLPQPDTLLFLQTAQITTSDTVPKDLVYDPANPDKLAAGRQDLDARRIAAVQKFMMAQTAGRGYDFQVAVIDPSEVGLAGDSGRRVGHPPRILYGYATSAAQPRAVALQQWRVAAVVPLAAVAVAAGKHRRPAAVPSCGRRHSPAARLS